MTKEFLCDVRTAYIDKIKNNSLTVLFSGYPLVRSGDQYYDFEVDKNFYYMTGIDQEKVIYLLLKKENDFSEILFLEENDPTLIKWIGAKLCPDEAKNISGIETVCFLGCFEKTLEKLILECDDVYLNFGNGKACFDANRIFTGKIKKRYPDKKYYDNSEIIFGLRSVKRKEEIEKIKESIKITGFGIEEMMRKSRPGICEYQLESYFDFVLKNNGQRKTAFKTIAAAGINATVLHYSRNNGKLGENDLILLDLGCRTEYYNSDISRTFPVGGHFTPRQLEIYREVLGVNKACIAFLKPGVTKAEYDAFARNLLAESCIRLGLITEKDEVSEYYFHSVGHSLGLDTHDPCIYQPYLRPGMVITVEPGLYIPKEKTGIRIEDDVLITEDGCLNLSEGIIKEPDEIEAFFEKENKFYQKR